jgi:hypothetical protein
MRSRRKPQQKLPFKRGYRIRKGNNSQGIGGAVMTLGKNLLQGKKFGSGMFKGVLRAGVTPGSGVGAGLGLAGALAGKSKNPLLQKIGKGLGMAGGVAGMLSGGGGGGGAGNLLANIKEGGGNFLANIGKGGGGGGLQNILQNIGKGQGGGGFGNILSSLVGGQSAAYGMRVKKYDNGGEVNGNGDPEKEPEYITGTSGGRAELLGGNPALNLLAQTLGSETVQAGGNLPYVNYGELFESPGLKVLKEEIPKDPDPTPEDIPEDIPPKYPSRTVVKKIPPEDPDFDTGEGSDIENIVSFRPKGGSSGFMDEGAFKGVITRGPGASHAGTQLELKVKDLPAYIQEDETFKDLLSDVNEGYQNISYKDRSEIDDYVFNNPDVNAIKDIMTGKITLEEYKKRNIRASFATGGRVKLLKKGGY